MINAYTFKDVEFRHNNSFKLSLPKLEIPAGSITALVGPNGSGKTTLLHVCGFLQFVHCGYIKFFGEDIGDKNKLKLRRQVGLLLQSPYLFRGTVISNLLWGLKIRGFDKHEARKRAIAALDMVNCVEFAKRNAQHLSGGESQKIALARCLAFQPKVLLLDEPSNHMDKAGFEFLEEIISLSNRDFGTTIILTTHLLDKIDLKMDRIIHLWNGKELPSSSMNVFCGVLNENGSTFNTGKLSLNLFKSATKADFLTIDPYKIIIGHDDNSANKNHLSGVIKAITMNDGNAKIDIDCGESISMCTSLQNAQTYFLGEKVNLVIPSDAINVFS